MARKRKTKRRKPIKRLKRRSPVIGRVVRLLFVLLLVYMVGDYVQKKYEEQQARQAELAALIDAEQDGFISQIAPISVAMQDLYGTRPSISIAQAILESDWGQSDLAAQYNNLYGVKGGEEPYTVSLPTLEYVDGEWVSVEANFKVYDSWTSSIEDHAQLMREGTSWNPEQYREVVEAPTYREAAYALQQAGYATDPGYPEKLIGLIEAYELDRYDLR